MKILVTNDDGIQSPVLALLAQALATRHRVLVVAPATDQSGMAQAFTHSRGLRYRAVEPSPYPAYVVEGTPCDCVKFGVSHLCRDDKVDLVISGVNLGENAGLSAIYSGTVAAAREGAMWGIPSLALSVWENSLAHLEAAVTWLLRLLERPGLLPRRPGCLWNVNFPACHPSLVTGVEVTDMGLAMFTDHYRLAPGPEGREEFHLAGHKPAALFRAGSDDEALSRGKITITPLQLDQTHREELGRLSALDPAEWAWAVPTAGVPAMLERGPAAPAPVPKESP